MYTPEALLDLHARAHRSLRGIIRHCAELDAAAIDQELRGFGYPTVRLQLNHVIGAEEYWFGVLRGAFRAEEDAHLYPTIEAIECFRERVAAESVEYLRDTRTPDLNAARTMRTWGGRERSLIPAHVVLRTQTHIFHHQGQVSAMCRLLGEPVPAGLDFPLD